MLKRPMTANHADEERFVLEEVNFYPYVQYGASKSKLNEILGKMLQLMVLILTETQEGARSDIVKSIKRIGIDYEAEGTY